MADAHFAGETLDDLLRAAIGAIQSRGERVKPSKGWCTELWGALLELTNPRARLSRTETRGKPFSCLGELCWYLSGSNDTGFIAYYIHDYRQYDEGGSIFGGYGPRLFNFRGLNQIAAVTALLRKKPSSRQAVIQLFDANDIQQEHKDVPCTCTLQFVVRNNMLHMMVYMRSNDVYTGFPHDVFCFTMLQEIMARSLSLELGSYKHGVGSLHLYDVDQDTAEQFLREGWQPTGALMPMMPLGDPWPAIEHLLKAEAAIRNNILIDESTLEVMDSYWVDLVRLLQVLRMARDNDVDKIQEIRRKMASSTYQTFIDKKIDECRRRLERLNRQE